MRKKILFAGVAMTTLFAACSNEEIFNEQAVVGQENRPMTEVALSFNEENISLGEGESRLAFENVDGGYQWTFKDGDKIGGLLMDTWNGEDCGIENFTMTDYVHTNYAFMRKTENGKTSWVTPENAPVCEGNYFFYFPYNSDMPHRGHVAWNINPVQKNYVEATGKHWPMQAVKDNQKWLGYKFVDHAAKGEVSKINFDFVPMFAMPTFDIINKAGDLKVNKLVLKVTSNHDNNHVSLYGKHDLMATTMVLTPWTRKFDDVNKIWEGEKDANNNWVPKTYAWHTEQMWYHAQSYSDFAKDGESYTWPIDDNQKNAPIKNDMRWDARQTKAIFALNNIDATDIDMQPTYEYTAEFGDNYYVDQFGHIQAMLVMPAGVYALAEHQTFEAFIYVTTESGDDYVVRIDLGKPQTQGGTHTSQYDDINSAAATKFLAPGIYSQFKAEFDASAMQSYNITDSKITSTDDLKWIVKEAKGNVGVYNLTVNTTGSRVVLTKEIEDMLKAKKNVRLYIHGEITIGDDTSEDAINYLWFNNPFIRTKLNIVNKQVKKVAKYLNTETLEVKDLEVLDNCSTITISKTGELVADKNVDINAAKVINKGILTANNITADVVNEGTATAAIITTIDKDENGVVNALKASLTATAVDGSIYNYGTAVVDNAVVVRNEGTMSIRNIDKLTNIGSGNGGWSNKAGTLTFLGNKDVTKEGPAYISSGNNFANVIVAGKTTLSFFNNFGGTVDVNDDVNVEYELHNVATYNADNTVKAVATINIAEGKTLRVRDEYPEGNAFLNNYKNAVINVEGNLAQNIKNSGEIFVKTNGQVVVNGLVTEEYDAYPKYGIGKVAVGIIDVTAAAGVMNDAQKAMDYKQGNEGNHFRYVVKETISATALKEALKARISSNNFLKNFVVVVFDAEKAMSYAGQLTEVLISHVLVADGTTLELKASGTKKISFMNLSNVCGTQIPYKAFEVENGAKVILADNATLELGLKSVEDNKGVVKAYVNGEFNANDHSVLAGNVEVFGTGKFWISTAAGNHATWKKNNPGWTGDDFGW